MENNSSSKEETRGPGEEHKRQDRILSEEDIDVLPVAMLNKSKLCKHSFGCTENVLRGWYKSFFFALLVKSAFNNVFLIANPKKFFKNLLDFKSNFDSIRLAVCRLYERRVQNGTLHDEKVLLR